MAGATLNLPALQALIALGDYGGRGFIQPSSAVLGLSAALFLSDLTIWQGAGDTLTSDEVDDIDAIIAQLECDLMLTGDSYAVDKCKITNSVDLTILPMVETVLTFDTDVYDPEDMHSTVSDTHKVYVKRDGLHLIDVQILWVASAIGYRELRLHKYNPVTETITLLSRSLQNGMLVTTRYTQSVSIQDESVEGEYYYVSVVHSSPSSLRIISDSASPVVAAVRL